jgi:hypothetical protein
MVHIPPEDVIKERMAFMKNLISLSFFLTAILLFPGCYTILFIEPTNDDASFIWDPIIPDNPEPWPLPAPPPGPCPPHPRPPLPSPPIPIQVIVIIIHLQHRQIQMIAG